MLWFHDQQEVLLAAGCQNLSWMARSQLVDKLGKCRQTSRLGMEGGSRECFSNYR